MAQQSRVTKQWLQRQFQSSGIQVEPAALTRLVQILEEDEDPENLLHSLLDEIETSEDSRKLTTALLESFMKTREGSGGSKSLIQVIDAYKAPLILYDPIRKLFHQPQTKRQLLADAHSKIQLYVDRFLLIQQRLRRNKLFRPVQFSDLNPQKGPSRSDIAVLTELKALLGLVGERKIVVGFLTRQDEGRYFIEDLSARLPLDISSAETADGLFTENCIVVAEGELTPGGHFKAIAIGLPPPEPRNESLSALQGLNFFGGNKPDGRNVHDDDRIILLSNIHLDRPDVLDNLHTVFKGYSSLDIPPSMFVLMGDFQSYDANAADVNINRIKDNFASLGRIIAQYPVLRVQSRFLLVPGPNDIGFGNVLPRPVLPQSVLSSLVEIVPSIEVGSNPCRLRVGPSELVICRSNLQRKMRGLTILSNNNNTNTNNTTSQVSSPSSSSLFDDLCATVLQQSHLCPVPLEYQPIAWEWDHSLWVYPLPHGLVLADDEPAATSQFDSCCCINPGSFVDGKFGAWNPVDNDMELCDIAAAIDDGDGDEQVEEEQEEISIDEAEEIGDAEGEEEVGNDEGVAMGVEELMVGETAMVV